MLLTQHSCPAPSSTPSWGKHFHVQQCFQRGYLIGKVIYGQSRLHRRVIVITRQYQQPSSGYTIPSRELRAHNPPSKSERWHGQFVLPKISWWNFCWWHYEFSHCRWVVFSVHHIIGKPMLCCEQCWKSQWKKPFIFSYWNWACLVHCLSDVK